MKRGVKEATIDPIGFIFVGLIIGFLVVGHISWPMAVLFFLSRTEVKFSMKDKVESWS